MEKGTEAKTIQPGVTAPDFSFKDTQGKEAKISDLRGKKRLAIYFYPRDFTPGCTTEAVEFSRQYSKFQDLNIEIIGVSPDDDKSHLKFREKMNIPYPLASDTENSISKQYGVYGLKRFMGKEFMGVTRSTFLVDTGGIIVKVFPKVKPAGHAKEILDYFS